MGSSLTRLLYHIVFSTKHREPLIDETIEQELYSYIGGVIRNQNGHLIEIGGSPDHVHILARFSQTTAVSVMLKEIKTSSSKWRNQRDVGETHFSWQVGYAAFSVSPSQLESVRRYIRNQKAHHRERSFEEELVMLLDRHGVEYDEEYLFD
jgi:REP element-mobilizing transposase RayT